MRDPHDGGLAGEQAGIQAGGQAQLRCGPTAAAPEPLSSGLQVRVASRIW